MSFVGPTGPQPQKNTQVNGGVDSPKQKPQGKQNRSESPAKKPSTIGEFNKSFKDKFAHNNDKRNTISIDSFSEGSIYLLQDVSSNVRDIRAVKEAIQNYEGLQDKNITVEDIAKTTYIMDSGKLSNLKKNLELATARQEGFIDGSQGALGELLLEDAPKFEDHYGFNYFEQNILNQEDGDFDKFLDESKYGNFDKFQESLSRVKHTLIKAVNATNVGSKEHDGLQNLLDKAEKKLGQLRDFKERKREEVFSQLGLAGKSPQDALGELEAAFKGLGDDPKSKRNYRFLMRPLRLALKRSENNYSPSESFKNGVLDAPVGNEKLGELREKLVAIRKRIISFKSSKEFLGKFSGSDLEQRQSKIQKTLDQLIANETEYKNAIKEEKDSRSALSDEERQTFQKAINDAGDDTDWASVYEKLSEVGK